MGMAHVMRSTSGMGVAVTEGGCSTYLYPRARLRKRFRFYEDAQRITRAVSPKLFRKNFSQAIWTARR